MSAAAAMRPTASGRPRAILGNHDRANGSRIASSVTTLNRLTLRARYVDDKKRGSFDQLAANSHGLSARSSTRVITGDASQPGPRPGCDLATQGTLVSGFYQDRMSAAGFGRCLPANTEFQECVDSAISLVKAGSIADAAIETERALDLARSAGADAALLGCTELSVVAASLNDVSGLVVIDSNAALARACLTRLGFRAQDARGLPTVSRLPGYDRSLRASSVLLARRSVP